MPKFHNRPKVVDAVQFDPWGDHKFKLPDGVDGVAPGADNWGYWGCHFWVTTAQGVKVPIMRGEWVITEDDGIHHYPCSDDEFRKRYYELVGE